MREYNNQENKFAPYDPFPKNPVYRMQYNNISLGVPKNEDII